MTAKKEQQKSNQEAYFAGIIDGEGCISYEKTKKDYSTPVSYTHLTLPTILLV